jgi:hypothetical protein
MSDFFEPPPPPKVEVEQAPREDWMGPPRRVVPAVVPVERVVARTDEVGIYLGEIPPGQLRLGFQFADGTKVTNTSNRFGWDGSLDRHRSHQ